MGITLAVSAFLCALTVLELAALKLEWEIPVLAKINGGSESYLFEEVRNAESALDESTENILLNEMQSVEKTQNFGNGTETGMTGGPESGDKADALEVEENQEDSRMEKTEVTGSQAEQSDLSETETITAENKKENTEGNSEGNSEKNPEEANSDDEGSGENSEESSAEEEEFPYYIKINRQQNCITIYAKDENEEYTVPVKAILCSTGLYNATPKGIFHLSTKYLWRQLHGGVYGQYATRITGGVLFHSVPYARKDKTTLYADKYNKLGQQASMGCVRLTVEDAKWISENCPSGTTVEIYDDEDPGPLGKPETVKIDLDSPNKGWDPTDPDPANPWHKLSDDE